MSLIVAMALSELEPENWHRQLWDSYEQDNLLLNFIKNANISELLSSKTTKSTRNQTNLTVLSKECLEFFNLFNQSKNAAATKDDDEATLQLTNKKCAKGTCNEDKQETEDNIPFPEGVVKIMYDQRNLLDLGSNVKENWPLVPAILPEDVNGYFQNRSQISWLKGARPPHHIMRKCKKEKDCNFKIPIHF